MIFLNSLWRGLVATVAVLVVTSSGFAAEGVRVRGEIVEVSGNQYTIVVVTGQQVQVSVAEPMVLVYEDIPLDQVTGNSYVSVPSIPMDSETWRALGVTVFPEPMRGMNEGFADWDLTAQSKMTNATVGKVISRGGERVLTLSYGESEQTVVVPETVPVTKFTPDPKHTVGTGDLVVVFAKKEGGKFKGKFIAVHKNGSLPPV